jgi:hypothetical protein
MFVSQQYQREKPTTDFDFHLWQSLSAMEPSRHSRSDDALLLLGRLDGRLHGSTCADIFLARSRLEGAATLAGLAGVPIAVRDLVDWITGRTPLPRVSEGLNDPISVAAIFHVAISRDEDAKDPVGRATLNMLRAVLDDRTAAETYASDDLAYFGPLWREVRSAADTPFPARDLIAVARRVFDLAAMTDSAQASSSEVVTFDGRSLALPPRSRDRNWLIATMVPRMLYRAGFTTRVIPSLVLLPKFLPATPQALADVMIAAVGKKAEAGLRDLDSIEREAGRTLSGMRVTKRSKAPLLARLQLTYPGIQAAAVAKLLNVTPQGARKLLAASSGRSGPVLV